ncbi:MAG: hypothetical protein J6U26_01615, partial [Lachnospiraceae bacterium]|nr:hypothetical protein [Lachnospiraceae bacterium]
MRTGFDGRYPEDAWEAERGTGVDPRTGLLTPREGEYTNFEPFCVRAGDVLVLKAEGPEYRTSFYMPETDPALVYTYCYQPEANWARYCPERSDPDWKKNMTVFDTDGYVRVTVRGTAAPPESLSGLLILEKGARSRDAGDMWPSWI